MRYLIAIIVTAATNTASYRLFTVYDPVFYSECVQAARDWNEGEANVGPAVAGQFISMFCVEEDHPLFALALASPLSVNVSRYSPTL